MQTVHQLHNGILNANTKAEIISELMSFVSPALKNRGLVSGGERVVLTLGLPFVRTSPDHGTAYDIAGSGRAKISSFAAAMKMAASMAKAE